MTALPAALPAPSRELVRLPRPAAGTVARRPATVTRVPSATSVEPAVWSKPQRVAAVAGVATTALLWVASTGALLAAVPAVVHAAAVLGLCAAAVVVLLLAGLALFTGARHCLGCPDR